MQAHGGDVYEKHYRMDYSVNVNPLGTPKAVMEAACEGIRLSAQYPDVECRRLRKKLSEFEGVAEQQLIFGNGAADLIFSLALARKPQKVLLPAPTFAEYEQAVRMVGSQVAYHRLSEENGFVMDEGILEQITPDVDMVFLCNPNNPTGLPLKTEDVVKILKACQKADALLVVDECFNEFLDEPGQYSVKSYLEEYENLFILKAFTKIYAMAGLRLGYGLTANQALIGHMREVNQPWCVSIPAQYAGEAALDETAYVEKSKALLRQERAFLKEELRRLGFQVYDSQANYIFFHGEPWLYEALKEQGILIRSCANYVGLSEGYYRIAVKTREENQELIRTMEEVIRWQKQL